MEALEPLLHLWDITDPFVRFWQSIFHLPDDMMRLSILLILTFPAVYIHRYVLANTTSRLSFSLVTGLLWVFFCFKWDALYYVGTGLATYLICWLMPSKHSPKVIILLSFGVLSWGHYIRYTELYLQYTVNWCTPFMLFCIKLQSFAWNVHDGQREPSKFLPAKNRIEQMPSLLAYFSWLFFFAGFLTGPVGEFQDYMAFTNRSMFKAEPNGQIPDSVKPALKKFAWMFVGIFGFYGAKLIPEWYCGTEEFLANPFWYRMIYLLIAVEVGFTKYYFAWFNGEAAVILIGAAYNGRDKAGNVLWNRIAMLDLIPFRLAHNRFMIHSNWNICSGEWLKHYVYVRIPVKVQKMINPVIITFAVSAYWHGFYPGYYLFFTLYAFYYIVEEAVDKKFKQQYIVTGRGRDAKPISATRYKLYIVVATLATWVYINSITITFRLLDWKRTAIAWSGIYYWTIIAAIAIFVLTKFLPSPPRTARVAPAKELQAKEDRPAEPVTVANLKTKGE